MLECEICMEKFPADCFEFFPCSHKTCSFCYFNMKSKKCPYCRYQIEIEEESEDSNLEEPYYMDPNYNLPDIILTRSQRRNRRHYRNLNQRNNSSNSSNSNNSGNNSNDNNANTSSNSLIDLSEYEPLLNKKNRRRENTSERFNTF